jgi:tetratricopeptide (TPR) repeat protein
MDARELLDRYAALGDERDFRAARGLYERAIAGADDARLRTDYGFLLESHARNELRAAVAHYERAIELDPACDKPNYQLISALAGLQEPEGAVARYERRLAASPGEVREHRFLAQAHLAVHAHAAALEVVEAGLALDPADSVLIAMRGEAKAGLGDPQGALTDWRRALELDPEDIGALYSTAFLLEREGRREAAAAAWTEIIAWCEGRGLELDARWPRQERARLRRELADA